MPHTLPPVDLQAVVQPPVHPAGHGQPAYSPSALSPSALGPASPFTAAEGEREGRSALPKDLQHTEGSGEGRSESHQRGMSRVRRAIKELVNDPFFHRPTKEQAAAEFQEAEMKRIILQEIDAARRSTEAGDIDRAMSRSRSQARASPLASGGNSPAGSRNGSRAGSRVREFFGGHKKEELGEETVKE